jgi:endogenous inhibitor of DNA gyrase (YacG/DUF329 family)
MTNKTITINADDPLRCFYCGKKMPKNKQGTYDFHCSKKCKKKDEERINKKIDEGKNMVEILDEAIKNMTNKKEKETCSLMGCELEEGTPTLKEIIEKSPGTQGAEQATILIKNHGFKPEDKICLDCFWK